MSCLRAASCSRRLGSAVSRCSTVSFPSRPSQRWSSWRRSSSSSPSGQFCCSHEAERGEPRRLTPVRQESDQTVPPPTLSAGVQTRPDAARYGTVLLRREHRCGVEWWRVRRTLATLPLPLRVSDTSLTSEVRCERPGVAHTTSLPSYDEGQPAGAGASMRRVAVVGRNCTAMVSATAVPSLWRTCESSPPGSVKLCPAVYTCGAQLGSSLE